jgi:holo-[acyl-carrier protein] synthase
VILGSGFDVVDIARVERLVRDHEGRLDRIFTGEERACCAAAPRGRRTARYASAFAGKEAVMKALGTGWRSDVQWSEIDTGAETGSGIVRLTGGALRTAERLGISRVFVSMASAGQTALATAFAEGDGDA